MASRAKSAAVAPAEEPKTFTSPSKMAAAGNIPRLQGLAADATDALGGNPLGHAAREGRVEVVTYLVKERGVDINVKMWGSQTALMLAAVHNHDGVVAALVSLGADVMAVDGAGNTAAHYAAKSGQLACLLPLIEAPSADGAASARPASAMREAPKAYRMEVVTARNAIGRTPLHVACTHGQQPAVATLLAASPELASTGDANGWTPLHVAASCGFAKICQMLVEAGADPAAKTNEGQDAVAVAASPAVVDALAKAAKR